jgi:HAD superfamily hydrolase (TIGR01509 family)
MARERERERGKILKFLYRKPDPKIYHYACDVIGIKPDEAIFLDDIGMNLRSANKLGMKTIRKWFGGLFFSFFFFICIGK